MLENLELMRKRLEWQGGVNQEDRMIKDKWRTLQRVLKYSYQACNIQIVQKYSQILDASLDQIDPSMPIVRALINPDKNKQDYDDKILSVDYFSKRLNIYYLSSFQLLTQGIIALIIALIKGITITSFTSMFTLESTISILFMGIISSAVAYTLQMVGQKYVNPTVSSLILSLESVFSALSAVLIYQFYKFSDVNQNMTIEEIIGSIIVFLAVILSQLPISIFKHKKKDDLKENQ